MQAEALVEKIKSLPSEKIAEVEDFVEFLAQSVGGQTPESSGSAKDETQKATMLREFAESMKANTFTGNPPRYMRDELHERRL